LTPQSSITTIWFLTVYKLLISKPCTEDLSLWNLHTYLKSEDGRCTNWNKDLKCRSIPQVIFRSHQPRKSSCLRLSTCLSLKVTVHPEEICDAKDSLGWPSIPLPEFTGKVCPEVSGLQSFPEVY